MSVEFRQRTPSEYAQILWRRKWLIVLPTVAIAFAVAIVVWKLPNVYESKTLLTVRPSSISSDVVPRLAEDDLTIRINNIQQEVFSRSSLQPIIEKYGLYAVERRRGEPMDVLVERMRTRDISVRLSTSRDVTNGFEILFRGPDPRVTMNVTAELASKYTKAQAKAASEDATQTKEFFESKLRQAKEELDSIDQQRLHFMMQNKEHLPSSANALIGQLAGLREEQKSINTSLDLLRQRRGMLVTQQADAEKQRAQEIDLVHYDLQDPKTTPAYASLVSRREQLKSEREKLLTEYRQKHPDVLAKQAEIDNVQREINEMIADWKQRIEERRKKLEAMSDPRVRNFQREIQDADAQMAALQKRSAATDAQIADINQRLSGVPTAEVGLEALNREYQSKKAVYDDLLAQNQKADIISSVQANAQGESIAVIDAASMPEKPVAPNRPVWMLFGLFFGLGFGLTCAALFEVPRLLTIQTSEDAEHYTGLPVLVSLPNLLTPREQRRLRARRAALAIAGVLFTLASIPALALLLRMTRLVEFLAMRG